MRSIAALLLFAGLATVATVTTATAAERNGATFPDKLLIGGVDVPLRGTALLKWKWIFKIEVGALYAAPGDPLADVPKRIEFHYLRDFSGADLAKATTECFDDNTDAATVARLQPELAKLNALFPPVKSGEQLALTYAPGIGVEVSHQGKAIGVVPGAEFGRAVCAIWLGASTFDNDFRDGLLGKK